MNFFCKTHNTVEFVKNEYTKSRKHFLQHRQEKKKLSNFVDIVRLVLEGERRLS